MYGFGQILLHARKHAMHAHELVDAFGNRRCKNGVKSKGVHGDKALIGCKLDEQGLDASRKLRSYCAVEKISPVPV